jgi:hypothetical protein
MPVIYGAIDLSQNELRNARVQNLASAPATPVSGQLWYDSTNQILKWWNGSGWVSAQGGAGAVPATTVTTEAVGDASVVGTATTYAREDHKHGREAFGAITAQTAFGAASGNGAAATVTRSDHTHGTPVHDAAAHSTIPISALAAATSFVLMGGNLIQNLATPLSATDAANKNYVDNAINGLSWKDLAGVATTANITLSGAQTIDGVSVVQGSRVLVKNQTDATQNGLYTAANGAWTRAGDADSSTELEGMAVYVDVGTVNGDTSWVLTTPGVAGAGIVVGTTPLTYVQFAGPGVITAGAGMTQVGNTLNVIAGDTSLTVAADDVRVNTGVIATVASVTAAVAGMAKKFAAALTGTASPEVITHNLNTRDVLVTILNGASPYTSVDVDWDATTVNTVTIRYTPNLGAGYRAVVVG